MKPSLLSQASAAVTSVVACGLLLVSPASAQTNYYFDPGATAAGTGSGGSGEFNSPVWYNGTSDTSFVPLNNAFFDGTAGTVTVDSGVSANYLEVGVTSGTETIGTTGADAKQITLGPVVANASRTMFQVDAGSENVVFNSNVNLLLENQTYGLETTAPSASSGNVTFNGGITFTDNVTLATDPSGNSTGSPGLNLSATAPGGTFTLNSAVTLVNSSTPGEEPTQNGNQPTIGFTGSNANNALILTSNADFIDTRVDANGGTVLDQGAKYTYAPGGESANGPILIGNGGQYLADAADLIVSDTTQFVGGGGSLGSDFVGVTTFSGHNSYNNSLVAISYAGSAPVNLVAGAGARVNILGDVQNGNGYGINKTGVGTVNIDDGYNFRIQGGGWDVQNGTLLVNSSGTIVNGTTPDSVPIGLTIDNVATADLSSAQTYATLGGNASVSALVTAVGANSSITPGDPTVNHGIGTLTLLGGLQATSGLTLNFKLNGADNSALVVGNFSLNGPVTVNFQPVGSVAIDTPYYLMTGEVSDLWTKGADTSFTFNTPAGYVLDTSYGNGAGYIFDTTPGDPTFSVEFVPEPSTWALMGLGAILVAGAARFRRQQA